MNWNTPKNETEHSEWLAAWHDWCVERPSVVRAVAETFTPWAMYRLTTTNQRCQVIGFHETEDGKGATVYVYAEHETLGPITGVNVFGIEPETLVPWTGSERGDWEITETPGGQDLGGGLVTGTGVNYRNLSEVQP